MLNQYRIANFKAFAGPVSIPIKPITLIFGANSSGKSSLLQSLLMLKQTLGEGDPTMTLVSKGNLVDLGSYREFVHRHETSRLFFVKVTMAIPDRRVFPDWEWVIGDNIDRRFDELLESVGSKSLGLGISFYPDPHSLGIGVSRLELFIGDEPEPILTYETDPEMAKGFSCPVKMRVKEVNLKHPFWHFYWQTFDEQRPDLIEDTVWAPVQKSQRDFMLEFSRMGKQERLEYITKLKQRLDEMEGDLERKSERAAEEKLKTPTGFERSLEGYRIWFSKGDISLKNCLPESLDGEELKYAVWDGMKGEDSRNISLLSLYASHLFRQFLKEVYYLGPLRVLPERHYTFSGSPSTYTGKSGEYVADILISDKEMVKEANEQLDRLGFGYELVVTSLSDPSSDIHGLYTIRLREKPSGVNVAMTDVGFGLSPILFT